MTVVGGGVVGLLTAWECAREGARVTLLDAAELPNRYGASYDRHRILRALHPQDADATRAAVTATARWAELARLIEARTPAGSVLHRSGALTVLAPDDARAAVTNLVAAGARAHLLDEPGARYQLLRLPSGRAGVLEPDGGILLADRVLEALTAILGELPGVRLRPGCGVVGIDPDAGTVRLADGETVSGDRVVVSAGPRTPDVLPPDVTEGLQLYRQTLLFCGDGTRFGDSWTGLPAVPALGTGTGAWLVPPVGGTPLKLSAASACRPVERIEGWAAPASFRAHLCTVFRDLLVGFRDDWVSGARDSYYLADAATHGPRLAELSPGRAWAFTACGGGAFKFAPHIARSLAERALGLPSTTTGLAHLDADTGTARPPHPSGAR